MKHKNQSLNESYSLIEKVILGFSLLFFLNTPSTLSQNFGTIELKKINNSVVFLREVRNKTINQNGYDYFIGLKDPETGIFYPYKTEFTGTGFALFDGTAKYIITVKHLAENLTDSSFIKFSGARTDSLYKLKDVLLKTGSKRWYFSDNTDIAIGLIKSTFYHEKDTIKYSEVKDTSSLLFNPVEIKNHFSLRLEILKDSLLAPFRDMELLSIGYPSGIGNYTNPRSTVSKFFRASSEIIDAESKNPYFIIDDPSVDGLSGAPTFEAPKIFEIDAAKGMAVIHRPSSCVGMINGTFNDANGGKFTSVIPSKLILEELKKIKNITYILDEYHENGNLWQEIIIQNNKFIEVLCNYDKNGLAQDKGTLKNGNGTIKCYTKEGELVREVEFKNGQVIEKNNKK